MGSKSWSTQTELGKMFALTAREVGQHLTELGLKEGASAAERAVSDGLAKDAKLRDGTVFYVWHTERVGALLDGRGLTRSTQAPAAAARGRGRAAAEPAPARSVAGYGKVVATDGSALGNPGPTGWAWVDQTTGETGAGGLEHGTNNIGELLALLEALRHAGPEVDLLVRADSQYVINIATKWAKGWKRRGWLKGDGKVPENLALVQAIDAELGARTGRTDFEWVRGHAGDEHNELADSLAVGAAKEAQAARRVAR
ncbi:ribonuclease H [Georgenia sp. SYP-B2076]|uniref:ribonuclease H family protein n=1 Tax=Georgenia sp. SYP-B2076 TaxID=2495881 RepID=UPI001F0BC87D|nr:ribonuclease H [Georgenia sp. SYP-B2076]